MSNTVTPIVIPVANIGGVIQSVLPPVGIDRVLRGLTLAIQRIASLTSNELSVNDQINQSATTNYFRANRAYDYAQGGSIVWQMMVYIGPVNSSNLIHMLTPDGLPYWLNNLTTPIMVPRGNLCTVQYPLLRTTAARKFSTVFRFES